jgi:hypothetical protein
VNAEGGCACGKVRYRLSAAPLIVHACHCLDCQRLTGSAFVINLWIERELVELTSGAPRPAKLKGGSGADHEVFFCEDCGVYVWSRYGGPADTLFVRAGTLDAPSAVRPDVHIFTRTKLPWLSLPEGVPAFEAFYDLKSVWPDESRRRLRENIGKSSPPGP